MRVNAFEPTPNVFSFAGNACSSLPTCALKWTAEKGFAPRQAIEMSRTDYIRCVRLGGFRHRYVGEST
jgi:hypothetical protein